ncbi:glycosyltransferase family 2 protein [Photobacterium damselae]|nr:glycosyltransferase family 2 protein [Photobacterium damselae]
MKNKPLVSVIIPVYNGKKYIKEAIDSIVKQTYDNLEIIVIDDGSTDGSYDYILRLYENENRLKLYRKENSGLIDTLNLGLKLVSGDYIARMDSDDISSINRIELQLEMFNNNSKLVLCGANFKRFGAVNSYSKLPLSDTDCRLTLNFGSPFCHPCVMFRRNIVSQEKILYRDKYKHSEDYAFFYEISKFGEIMNIEKSLLDYRVHDRQVSKLYREEQLINTMKISMNFNDYFTGCSNDDYYNRSLSFIFSKGFSYKEKRLLISTMLGSYCCFYKFSFPFKLFFYSPKSFVKYVIKVIL